MQQPGQSFHTVSQCTAPVPPPDREIGRPVYPARRSQRTRANARRKVRFTSSKRSQANRTPADMQGALLISSNATADPRKTPAPFLAFSRPSSQGIPSNVSRTAGEGPRILCASSPFQKKDMANFHDHSQCLPPPTDHARTAALKRRELRLRGPESQYSRQTQQTEHGVLDWLPG